MGKRIVCCRRFGKDGCGRTLQLYLDHIVPQRHYNLLTLIAFIVGMLKGRSVHHAYQDKDERGPDDELRLQFEALQQFSPKEKEVAKSVLESLILKHDSNRFNQVS